MIYFISKYRRAKSRKLKKKNESDADVKSSQIVLNL